MTALLDCPELECWQALFDDTVALEQWQAYEHHLQSCRACQERVHQAEDNRDELLTLVRQLSDAVDEPREQALDCLLERTRGIKSPLVPRQPPEPIELTFLRPAPQAREGLLGMLGDYEVLQVIGEGGMGVVLKAFEPALQRLVAIKIMAPSLASSVNARRRFTREARSAAAVRHEHVVKVHQVSEQAGLPYLVMEYISGESLQSRLDRDGPLELEEIVRIGLQTARGLAGAHQQGLIHRDIKPANILLGMGNSEWGIRNGEFGMGNSEWGMSGRLLIPHSPFPIPHSRIPHSPFERVKITDFGLARMVDDIHLTQQGVVAGTPEYMAPEQARGEDLDHRADLFSLGSVLYALCAGAPPFQGSSALGVLRQVSDEESPAIRSLNPAVPSWLEALIGRLMAKDPARRFQSAAEVAGVLESRLAQLRQTAIIGISDPSPHSAHDVLERSKIGISRRLTKPFSRRRRLAVGLFVAAFLMLVSVLFGFRDVLFPAAAPPAKQDRAAAEEQKDAQAKKQQADEAARKPFQPARVQPKPLTPQQRRAVDTLNRLGAKIRFNDFTGSVVYISFEPGTDVDPVMEEVAVLTEVNTLGLQGTKISDASLKQVARFTKLRQLYLGQTAIADEGVQELTNLEHLTHLGLENTRVTDAGMKFVANLKALRYLNVGATGITDRCLKDLRTLPKLSMLCVYATAVTDAGMKDVKEMTNLDTLLVQDTTLTDAAIADLTALTRLKKINASNTMITSAGIEALKQAVPQVRVEGEVRTATGAVQSDSYVWLVVVGIIGGFTALTAVGVFIVTRKSRAAQAAG